MLAKLSHQQRDGLMTVNGNFGSAPNYEPNSESNEGKPLGFGMQGVTNTSYPVHGEASRHIEPINDADFFQAGRLYEVQSAEGKTALVNNLAGHLGHAKKAIQQRQLSHIKRANAEFGQRVELAMRKAKL
jgi:catalase